MTLETFWKTKSYLRSSILFTIIIGLMPLFIFSKRLIFGENNEEKLIPTIWDDSPYYFSKISSVMRGDIFQQNVYFKRLSAHTPINQEFVGEIVYGVFSKILFNSIVLGYCIVTLIAILTIFNLVIRDSNTSKISLTSSILFFTLIILFKPEYIFRPINPILPITILIAFFFHHEKNIDKKIFIVLSNCLPFINIFYSLIITCFLLYKIIIKKISKKIFSQSSVGLLIYIFFQIYYFKFVQIDSSRWGTISSHLPGAIRENIIGILLLTLTVFLQFKKKSISKTLENRIIILVSTLILMNSQILTGKSMEFGSHFGAVIYLLLYYSISFDLVPIIVISLNLSSIYWLSGFSLLLLIVSMRLNYSYLYAMENMKIELNLVNLCKIKYDQIIVVDENKADLVPIYCSNKLIFSKSGTNFFSMSDREVMERRVLNKYLLSYNRTNFIREIQQPEFIYSTFDRFFINLDQRISTAKKLGLEKSLIITKEKKFIAYKIELNDIIANGLPNNFKSLQVKYMKIPTIVLRN